MTIQLTIKQKLVVGIVVSICIAASLVGYFTLSRSKSTIEDRLLNTELPAIVRNLSNSVSEAPSTMLKATRQLTLNPFVSEILEHPENLTDDEEQMLVSSLISIKQQYGLEDASISNRNTGHYWNQNGFLRQLDKQKDSWFFGFTQSGMESQVNIYNNPATNEHKMFVNYQVLDGHVLAGFSKSITDMIKLIDSFKIEKSGFIYLVDSEGVIKIHADQRLMETKSLIDIYGGSFTLKQQSLFNASVETVDSESYIVATSYIPELNWYLVLQVPESEVFASVDDAAIQSLLLIMGLILSVSLLGLVFATKVTKPLTELSTVFKELGEGEGDLSYRVSIKNKNDEIGQLAIGFNSFITKIQNVTDEVAKTGLELNESIGELNDLSSKTEAQSEVQRDQIIQVVAAINQMSATINEIANNASDGANSSQSVELSAQQGQEVIDSAKKTINQLAIDINSTASTINELADMSNQVGAILDVIRNISEQTNLLALNAAIEAARAGEQGRGFAVVADEVRNLASKTAESTNEIQSMIDELQAKASQAVDEMSNSKSKTQAGVEATDRATTELQQIAEGISLISNMTTAVATATEEQSSVVAEINMNIETINEVNNETTKSASNIAESTVGLSSLSKRLKELVVSFEQR
ncbi:methyl-accepting chemotaxis protein [Vibrio owensii]|uniref:methyl-accepting chemotaxis protein n=1 Tax=Vibrio harveyi group TaxID=717610 RepID=UPI003CC6044E